MNVRAPVPLLRVSALACIALATWAIPASAQAACAAPMKLPASFKRPAANASPSKLAIFRLSLPQHKPCDVNLFTSKFVNGANGLYPEGSPMEPATTPAPSEEQVRAQLDSLLQDNPERADALRVFDDPGVKAKIAPPSIRAALRRCTGRPARARSICCSATPTPRASEGSRSSR